jgi:hypothetical protein
MHRLMAMDDEHYNAYKLWQIIFLPIWGKKLIMFFGRLDEFDQHLAGRRRHRTVPPHPLIGQSKGDNTGKASRIGNFSH